MADITGTAGNDVIVGTADPDTIDGAAGNDKINSGSGNDIVYGGLGNDAINGEANDDTLYGGAGNDVLTGDAGKDMIYGGDGNDGVFGGGLDDRIWGDAGADGLNGDGGNDEIYGGADADKLYGGTGNDRLNGDAGADILNGEAGNDTLVVRAGEGADTLYGGAGIDTFELQLTAADVTSSLKSDLAAFDAWMQQNLASAGSTAALGNQTTGSSFTFASLGVTLSVIEAINILVDGVSVPLASFLNQAPSAAPLVSFSTNEDTPFLGSAVATDADGDTLSWSMTQGPAHGTLSLDAATGQYTYTPAANFHGADAFSVTVMDTKGASAVQQVTVGVASVNDAPVAPASASLTTGEDTPVSGQVAATDVDGDTLGWSLSQGPASGTVTLDVATGQYTYTPGADFNGADTFSVTVTDASGASAVQQVNVAVAAVNDAPVTASTASLTTGEDTPVSGQVAATDVDGDTLGWSLSQSPANGSVALDAATGQYTYTPGADFNGADTFSVTVTDASGASAVQLVTVGVASVNDAPVTASTASLTTGEDTPVSGQVEASDVDGDVLTWNLDQGPDNGTVKLDEASGKYTYIANANFSGTDVFSVAVSDGAGGSVTQKVVVDIAAVADVPVVAVADAHASAALNVAGTSGNDTLTGGIGDDNLSGGAGNDTLTGDGGAFGMAVVLDIHAALADLDGSESLSIVVGGVPAGASLSAGTKNLDGSWSLTETQLSGLTMKASNASDFDLTVTAKATESTGQSATTSAALHVSFDRGGGNDTLDGGTGNDSLYGGVGNDRLIDGTGDDLAYGGSGDDTFAAGLGNDTYDGGDGFDTLDMSASSVAVQVDLSRSSATGLGTDKVLNMEGVVGSSFDDDLTGSKVASKLWGGAGSDKLSGGAGDDLLDSGTGNDVLYGGSGNDILSDGTGNDELYGGSGDDYMIAGSGTDKYVGGSGFDTIDYSAAGAAIIVDASKKTVVGWYDDKIDGIEKIIGSAFGDTFKGGKTGNVFDGGAGNDTFRGMGGADSYTGGAGNDTYVWYVKDVMSGNKYLGGDLITDFGAGDKLDLREFTKAFPGAAIGSVVHIADTAQGSVLSVKIGTAFEDLVTLHDVHGVTAAGLLADGMILA